jgi:hypothetical protein
MGNNMPGANLKRRSRSLTTRRPRAGHRPSLPRSGLQLPGDRWRSREGFQSEETRGADQNADKPFRKKAGSFSNALIPLAGAPCSECSGLH